jgi:hypothetical protein
MVIVLNQTHAPLRLEDGTVIKHRQRVNLHSGKEHEMEISFTLPQFAPPDIGANFELPKDATGEPVNDPLFCEIIETMNYGSQAAERALTAARAALNDTTRTPPAQHIAASEFALKITKPALERHDKTRGRINAERQRLQKITAAPPPPPDAKAQSRANLICESVHRMKPEHRRAAVLEAIKQGDNESVAAILSMPHFVSGFSPIEATEMKENWRRARYPEECARLDWLDKRLEDFNRSGSLLVAWPLKLFARHYVEEGRRSHRVVNDALTGAV